ncbi:hypothetical protein SLA2020_388850 [Shorea laevis]
MNNYHFLETFQRAHNSQQHQLQYIIQKMKGKESFVGIENEGQGLRNLSNGGFESIEVDARGSRGGSDSPFWWMILEPS